MGNIGQYSLSRFAGMGAVAMMRTAIAIGICWIGLFAGTAIAQDVVSGDAGTLIEGVASKLFPAKPPYTRGH